MMHFENAKMYYDKGVGFLNEKKYQKAIECFDSALGIDPGYGNARTRKGFALYRSGRYNEALEVFNKAIRIYPKDGYAIYHKSLVLRKLGKYNEATELEKLLNDPKIKHIYLEKQLEAKLIEDIGLLKKHGYDLELIKGQHKPRKTIKKNRSFLYG